MRSQNPSCCLARWQPVRFVPAARYVNKRKIIEEENPLSSFANIANFHQSTKFFAINRFQNMPTSRHTYSARWYQAGVFGRDLRGNSLAWYQAGVFWREFAWKHARVVSSGSLRARFAWKLARVVSSGSLRARIAWKVALWVSSRSLRTGIAWKVARVVSCVTLRA